MIHLLINLRLLTHPLLPYDTPSCLLMPYYTRSFLSHHLAHPLNPSISISPFYPLTGMISGAVAGLVCITPASGYVDMTGAFFIGFFGGPLCYAGAQLKHMLGYDDALDAFGVHAIGGIVGGIATGFFATDQVSVFAVPTPFLYNWAVANKVPLTTLSTNVTVTLLATPLTSSHPYPHPHPSHPSPPYPLSLTSSLSHTHTHTLLTPHPLSHTLTLTPLTPPPYPLSLTLTLSHTPYPLSLTLTLSHTPYPHSLTHPLPSLL